MALIQLIFLFITSAILPTFAKKPIPIGGIFHKDNYDANVAFHNAIMRENMYNPRVEFKPIVKIVDRDDSFKAEKIACGLASEGVVAIFGPSSVDTSKIVGSICNELGIPHILANWLPEDEIDTSEHHKYTRNFFPDNNFYATALSQIIADYEWKGFTLIYENSDSLERLLEILQMHNPEDSPVTIRQLPADTDDYKPLLKEIKISLENRIIIDCSTEKVMELLKQATMVKMMEDYQSYIITSLDAHMLDFAELKFFRSNVTTVRIMDPQSHEVTTAASDWQQYAKERMDYRRIYTDHIKTEAALYNDAVRVFLTAFRESNAIREITPIALKCTNPQKWNQGMQILQMMDQKTEEGMTGRIVFDDDGRRKDFYMEILELGQEGFKKIATLDPKDLHITYTRTEIEVHSQVKQALQNRTLIVAVRIGEPYVKYKEPKEGEYLEGNDRFEGYAVDLIDEISKILGFNYKLEAVEGNAYGSYNKKTKKWNGLVKQILDRKADLAICDLTITYERRTAVDFTMPFMTLGISILYAKPHKEPPKLFSFMSPLSIDVWIHMATAYLCLSILLFFLAKIATDDWEKPPPVAISQTNLAHSQDSDESEVDVLQTIWNMHNWIWLVAGSIMQQGCDILPKAVSTRLTAGLWWFFALIVISSYTANLAAFLTNQAMEGSIGSAEDLVKQNDIKYGAVRDGSTLQFFRESNFSTYSRMWTAMESASPSVLVDNNEEGIRRVLKGNRMYAFLMESTTIEYHVERKCNLTQIGNLLDSKGYGIALPVNSPYRTYISQTILKMQEEGQLKELKDRWWLEENACDIEKESEGDDTPELGMDNVGGCFLVLLGGIGVAILLGILEFLWHVNQMSVNEKVRRWDAFKEEIIFAFDFRKKQKPVRINLSERDSTSNRSSKSINTSHGLRSGYHIGLDHMNNILS